jgi:outer membrane protein assembly factor BamB
MPPDPLYIASVAETVRSSLRNTDEPAEIRRYLYELRDALYEAQFDGELAEELFEGLEEHIDRLNPEAIGSVDDSRRSRIIDHVHRVERFCQREHERTPDNKHGAESSKNDISQTSQDITINFGNSVSMSGRDSPTDESQNKTIREWRKNQDTTELEPIGETSSEKNSASDSVAGSWCGRQIDAQRWHLSDSTPMFGSVLADEGWPTYRGDLLRQGTDADFGLFSEPTLDWVADIGGSPLGEPAVLPDQIVVPTKEEGLVYLDRDTGDERTRFDPGVSCYASPTVYNNTVYCGFDDGLYAVNPWGRREWKHTTFEWVRTVPLVVDDVVLFGDSGGTFYAVDAGTGNVHGSFTHDPNGNGSIFKISPAIYEGIIVAGTSHTAMGIDYESGAIKWTKRIPVDQNSEMKAPAVVNDTVYYPGKEAVYALTPQDGSVKWRTELHTDGTVRSAVASDGRSQNSVNDSSSLYVTTHGIDTEAELFELSENGTIKSSFIIGNSTPTSPIAMPNGVVVGTMEGAIERYEESMFPEWAVNPDDRWTRAAPIVDDGKLYASFGRSIYAYS